MKQEQISQKVPVALVRDNGEKYFTYYPQLDSLRAIACISVMLFHSNTINFLNLHNIYTPFKGGLFGVDVFFVLSGYLISSILIKQYASIGTIQIKKFYLKRLLRLYPPIILIVLVILVPILFVDRRLAISNMFFVMTYTNDAVMLFQKIFPYLQYPLMFGHCWSLAVEEQFYLFFPVLFALVLKYYKNKPDRNLISTFPSFLVVFFFVLLVSNILLGPWFYKFFLWRFFQIFSGVYTAIFFSRSYSEIFPDTNYSSKIKSFVRRIYTNKYVFRASVLLLLYVLNFPPSFQNIYNMHYLLVTIASSVIIINIVLRKSIIVNNILMNKKLIYLGKISYGLYLYHVPILNLRKFFLKNADLNFVQTIVLDVVCFSLIFSFTMVSYEYYEKRILAYKALIV